MAVAEVAYKKFNPSSNPDFSEGASGALNVDDSALGTGHLG
jgi:hypothetical protein